MHDISYRKSKEKAYEKYAGNNKVGRHDEQCKYLKKKEYGECQRNHKMDESFMLEIRDLRLKLC